MTSHPSPILLGDLLYPCFKRSAWVDAYLHRSPLALTRKTALFHLANLHMLNTRRGGDHGLFPRRELPIAHRWMVAACDVLMGLPLDFKNSSPIAAQCTQSSPPELLAMASQLFWEAIAAVRDDYLKPLGCRTLPTSPRYVDNLEQWSWSSLQPRPVYPDLNSLFQQRGQFSGTTTLMKVVSHNLSFIIDHSLGNDYQDVAALRWLHSAYVHVTPGSGGPRVNFLATAPHKLLSFDLSSGFEQPPLLSRASVMSLRELLSAGALLEVDGGFTYTSSSSSVMKFRRFLVRSDLELGPYYNYVSLFRDDPGNIAPSDDHPAYLEICDEVGVDDSPLFLAEP